MYSNYCSKICTLFYSTWPFRCLSLGKYLEHRFHSHAYKRRLLDVATGEHTDIQAVPSTPHQPCAHSMHRDHVQYFLFKNIVATFAYSPIECWEIGLPAPILSLHWNMLAPGDALIDTRLMEETKSFSQLGYEVFAKIYDQLASLSSDSDFPMLQPLKQCLNKDQLAFRDRVGVVQTLMTEQVINMFDVHDAMLLARKSLSDSIELWNHKLAEAAAQSRIYVNVKAETGAGTVDAGTICTEDLRPDSPSESAAELPVDAVSSHSKVLPRSESADSSNDSSPAKQVTETQAPTKDQADKKSVKTLLREFLPSDKLPSYLIQSPLPSNEHHSLPTGLFPLLVNDQDMSSVIGYSLVSANYKKALDAMQPEFTNDTSSIASGVNHPSPSILAKKQEGSVESADERDVATAKESSDKKTKCANQHIEASFHVSIGHMFSK